MGVIFILMSPWLRPLDGWIFTFFTHWWPFPVATLGAPVSLPRGLLTDYCLQISYGHRELYTGSQGHGAQRLEKGEREAYCSQCGLTLSSLPVNGLKRRRCGGSVSICTVIDLNSVITFTATQSWLWIPVSDKRPRMSRKSKPPAKSVVKWNIWMLSVNFLAAFEELDFFFSYTHLRTQWVM